MGTPTISATVEAARARLATIRARELLRRFGGWVVLFACGVGLARPLIWPLSDSNPVWMGAPRALGLALAVMLLGWMGVYWAARRKPTRLRAARALDERLELREVVASGLMLRGESAEEELARARADEALEEVDLRSLFPMPRSRPRWRSLFMGVSGLLIVVLGGSYDPALARILMAPPTIAELEGAADLADAAAELEERSEADEIAEPESPEERPASDEPNESLAEQATEIARDLGRGDRESALQKLRSMRDEANARRDENRELDRAARRMAEHLDVSRREPSSTTRSPEGRSESSTRPDAEESMSLLARRMRDPQSAESTSEQERQRTLERLSRAADEARRSGSQHGEQLAEALSRAADAMNRGAMEEAARRMEEAAARSAQLQAERERMQAQAEALARLLERAGMLERDVQLAMMGREPGEAGQMMAQGEGHEGSDGEGRDGRRGLAEGLAARLAAMGLAEQPGSPGTGRDDGGRGSTRPGRTREGLEAHGDLHARSRVREGERAVQVLEGLGRNGEAETQYSDVYPSYGAIAEDALASEDVPAARREAVRRYFELIRPSAREEL